MLKETNRYAATHQSDKPHARPWHDVTVKEMRAFVGMLILMGICRFPRLHLYWQIMVPLIKTDGISNIMSRVRFQQIFIFLHLADSAGQVPAGEDGHDKLYEIRSFMDLLTQQFFDIYTPTEYVTIDEAMIPYKGRLGFKKYMKDKPTKWVIKVLTQPMAMSTEFKCKQASS